MAEFATEYKKIIETERSCAIKTLDGEAAWKIGKLIRLMWLDLAKLDKDVAGIVICVRLFSGHTLFSAVVGPGTSPRNWEMVDRKFNTVRVYGHSSWAIGRKLLGQNKSIDSLGPEHAAHGGAVPIFIEGLEQPVGAVVVSGLSQEKDDLLGRTALESL